MPDLDAFLLPTARRFYNSVTKADQEELDGILYTLRIDPYVDDVTKFSVSDPPANPVLYTGGRFYVVYDFENAYTLAIWDIGYDDPRSIVVPKPPEHG